MKGKMTMLSLQANPTLESPRKYLKDIVDTVENLGIKQQNVPIKKQPNKGSKGKFEHKKKQSTKRDHKGKRHKEMSKLNVLIVVNMDIMHKIVQKNMIRLIFLKKVSKKRKSRICWIWTIVV